MITNTMEVGSHTMHSLWSGFRKTGSDAKGGLKLPINVRYMDVPMSGVYLARSAGELKTQAMEMNFRQGLHLMWRLGLACLCCQIVSVCMPISDSRSWAVLRWVNSSCAKNKPLAVNLGTQLQQQPMCEALPSALLRLRLLRISLSPHI